MASNFLEYAATRNAKMQAVSDLLDGGFLNIYTGPQPSSEGVITGTLLASLQLSNPSGTVSTGTLTFGAIGSASAQATDLAGYAALLRSDNSTVVATGGVGVANSDFILNTLSFTFGNTVSCTVGALTAPP